MEMNDNFAVHVKDVCKSYGKKSVLRKLCMTVEKGTIYGLLGSSGCGKTTILSEIVGRHKPDEGEIYVFGEKCRGVLGARVGYMPQDIALVGEFTVKDTIFFFGRVFNMPDKLILERFNILHALLDLPPNHRYLRNCSGGEKRRISFAASVIHKPKLLILDEPTVGTDPILRSRIWNYIVDICTKEHTTVMITTHYIEEARQSHKIGLMREGRLLVEESPIKLLGMFNTDSLEEVYFLLSKRQEDEKNLREIIDKKYIDSMGETSTDNVVKESEVENESKDLSSPKKEIQKKSFFSVSRVLALLDKNLKQFYRNYFFAGLLLSIALIQILIFMIAIGGDVQDIPLSVINYEVKPELCDSMEGNDVIVDKDFRHINNISCRFLKYMDSPMIKQVYYDSFEQASQDAIHGKVVGVLSIHKNISQFFETRINAGLDEETVGSVIDVSLDMSNMQIGPVIQSRLTDVFMQFQRSLYIDCLYDPRIADIPIRVEEYMFGKKDEPFNVFITPGLILQTIYALGMMLTAGIIIMDKNDGIWERSIIAGVTALEIIISHFIIQSVIVFIMSAEELIAVFGIYQMEYVGHMSEILLIVFLQGISGIVAGVWVSSVSTSHSTSNSIMFGIYNVFSILCGFFWPLEAMPTAMRIIAKCMPLTIPTQALRNVVSKGWHLSHLEVLNGVGVIIAWSIGLGIFSVFLIKMSR